MNTYRSELLFHAMLALSDRPVAASLVGPREPALRRVSALCGQRLFAQRLYVFAEPWGTLVHAAVAAVAQRVGCPATAAKDAMALETWVERQSPCDYGATGNNDLDYAYWTARAARKWKNQHPGVEIVAFAAEFDEGVRDGLARWLDHAAASVPRGEGKSLRAPQHQGGQHRHRSHHELHRFHRAFLRALRAKRKGARARAA